MCDFCKTNKAVLDRKVGNAFGKDITIFATVENKKLIIGFAYDYIHEIDVDIHFCPMCGRELQERR